MTEYLNSWLPDIPFLIVILLIVIGHHLEKISKRLEYMQKSSDYEDRVRPREMVRYEPGIRSGKFDLDVDRFEASLKGEG